MSEISTRVWLDERLWDAVRQRALREGATARDVIPQLVGQALSGARAAAAPVPQPATVPLPALAPSPPQALAGGEPAVGTSGFPIVPMAEQYECGVCHATLRLGAVSQHVNRHLKESQSGA
ncbi:MAG: hypothetical protein ACYDCQ_14330 [Dehalococcoidia bacterium]